ncbi:hypothetical protein BDW69DRAFT_191480 [Aspergillus filifer]
MALPIVIVVHGAWHTPANYASFIAALRAQGFPITSRPSGNWPLSFVAAGQRILMIMHSYGGAVGSEAVQGLATPSSPTSTAPGVIHLLYLCAYILPPAVSVWDIVVEAGFDRFFDQYVETADDGSIFPLDPALMFFGGDETVPKAVIDEALKTLVRFPRSAPTTRTRTGPKGRGRGAADDDTIHGADDADYGVPRPYEDIMLAKVKAQGVQMRIEDLDTCHSVFISREREMVRLAVEAAQDERNPTGDSYV